MNTIKLLALSCASLAMIGATAPASAAVITYNVSGTFNDGKVLSGSFGLNDTGSIYFAQLTNIAISISGLGMFTSSAGASYSGGDNQTGPFSLDFFDPNRQNSVSLYFIAEHQGFKVVSIANQELRTATRFQINQGLASTTTSLASGTISSGAVAAIPEPATWAMMMVGFAMVGGAARYRRRSATVRYA